MHHEKHDEAQMPGGLMANLGGLMPLRPLYTMCTEGVHMLARPSNTEQPPALKRNTTEHCSGTPVCAHAAQPHHSHIPTRAHAHKHTCAYTHTHTYTHARTRIRTHTHMRVYTYARIHTRTRVRARTHTHTHTLDSQGYMHAFSSAGPSAPPDNFHPWPQHDSRGACRHVRVCAHTAITKPRNAAWG